MSARLVFDETLCMGCYACETACRMWHGCGGVGQGYRVVEAQERGVFPDVTRTFRSVAIPGCDLCRSCGATPHCALTCPTGALSYR